MKIVNQRWNLAAAPQLSILMKNFRARVSAMLGLALPGALLGMLAIASGATSLTDEDRRLERQLPVEQASLFPDAPYGVDPVVTGPVSAKFRETREAFGCDRAVWPNIPAACYPE